MSSTPPKTPGKTDAGTRAGVPEAIARIEKLRVVDNRTYVDSRVYDLELERIFDRVWLFVAHESEIASPGDYVTMTVAGNPMLLTRDREGRLRAFHNVCRHRGARVASEASGHCSAFRCPYHFWTYSLEGKLVSIPGEEAYCDTGFEKKDFGLVEAPCASVLGLVFIHMQDRPDQTLEEWLGPEVIATLSKPLANDKLKVFHKSSAQLAINWKVFAENIRDGYHVPFVHPFFRAASPPGKYHLHRNSHAVQELGMDFSRIEPDLAEKLQRKPLPGVAVGEGYIVNIWPDVAITLRSSVVSIDYQMLDGPTSVVAENRTLGLASDDGDTLELRRLQQETWFRNPVELEDRPVFFSQQAGVASRKVRYSVIARGKHAMEGTRGDDNRLRHFWVKWRELMGVDENSAAKLLEGS
jgi:phenylpropionate dioxygenase-like ring-hydroxylating dioxygenase large terminal subunit